MRFERFSGSHFSMGLQHGKAFRDQLQQRSHTIDSWSPETQDRVDSLVRRFESSLSGFAPELIEEMQGIAQGAGMSYQDVARLNFSEEIGIPIGCSQVGLVNRDGDVMMGKAEDAGFSRTYVVTELNPDQGFAQIHVGAINWVVSSGSGINEAGLCIGQSSLRIFDEAEGVPRLTMLRLALERCATVSEASELIQTATGGIRGMNFLMVDAKGEMAVIERSPSRCAIRQPANGAIWATNHPVDPRMRAVEHMITGAEPDFERDLAYEANSRQRFGRLDLLTRDEVDGPGVKESLQRVMTSHGPGGACQHGVMETTWTVMMAPRSRELWLSDGPPCRNPFELYSFGGRQR